MATPGQMRLEQRVNNIVKIIGDVVTSITDMQQRLTALENGYVYVKEITDGTNEPADGGGSFSAYRPSSENQADDPAGEKDASEVAAEPDSSHEDGGGEGMEQGTAKRGPGRPKGSKNKPAKKLRKGDGGKAA